VKRSAPLALALLAAAAGGSGGCRGNLDQPVPAPTIAIAAAPDSVAAGQASTLTWSAVHATACTAAGGWAGSRASSGSQSVAPGTTTTYALTCTGAGGNARDSVTVTVVPVPTVALTASPDTIAAGQTSTLTWTSTDATGCTAGGGWSGSRATSGSANVTPDSTTTYTLSCTGVGGSTGRSVTVAISSTPAAPVVTLAASPDTVASGATSTLTWTSSNASGCSASGGWTGTKGTSGTQGVAPTVTTTYTLTCTGTGGSTSTSVTVTVAAAPTVTLTATPDSIGAGQSSTLAWTSTNTTGCSASGGWTGARSTSGSQSVSPTATTTYTLSCTGPGGSASQAVTVKVGATTSGAYAYPLRVGPTGRHLVDQNGKAFLLVGDAAWSLIAQLTDTAADSYLANRQQLGFDAVLVNLIEHLFSDSAPRDIYGLAPFTGKLFTTPNAAYFAHADHIIQSAAQKGILVLLVPAYTGYGCEDQGWATEMQAASDSDMTAWGRFLGQHYAGYDNIVWVIGGDADPTTCSPSVKGKLQDMVNGILQYDTRHPFTAHNQRDEMGIVPWTGASWLDVNTTYTSSNEYSAAGQAYALTPTLPFFLIEAYYENEGAGAQELRAQSYWTLLAGGFGHVFGNCPIWFFGSRTGDPSCGTFDWRSQLGAQGSLNMEHFQKLFTARHWASLVPDLGHTVVTSSAGGGTVTAACAADSTSIVAYLPSNSSVTVSGACLRDSTMTAWWVNPSNGQATSVGTFSSRSPRTFTTPSGSDWVLVVDSPSSGFGTPGG
jgi:Protein of unknown function (DUF4038)/Putative collagen-binding domain of a collagenase